jgi:predicted tellurium resistance membrane protein TerC
MQDIFSLAGISGLLALTFMEVMLGIDNVIFVSIILDKLPDDKQRKLASRVWMIVGTILRMVLLYVLSVVIDGNMVLFTIVDHPVTLTQLIMIGGGLFLLVSTTLEIHNKMEGEDEHEVEQKTLANSFGALLRKIIIIDLVFSFDSIITAIGMASNPIVQIIAVLIALAVMFLFANKISKFIQQHPTFKVLALSFLILIGFALIVDGINVDAVHIPHGYIYFAMAFSFGVEIVNLQIRKNSKKVKLNAPDANDAKSELSKKV